MNIPQSFSVPLFGFLDTCCWAFRFIAHRRAGTKYAARTEPASLPDSPQPKQQDASNAAKGTTSRFVGYVSNKSFFFPDLATSPGPLSTGEKFELFVNQSISPPYLLAAGFSAACSQARDVPKAYGQGWDAFGGRFGASLARASSDSFFSTFVFASVLHQDPRFFPEYHPTLWGSMKYSARRLFVTRTDSGREQFNTSGLLGPLAAETLANAYLPRSEQTGCEDSGTIRHQTWRGNLRGTCSRTIGRRFFTAWD